MRKLHYEKINELLDTLQEAADILANTADANAAAGLISDMAYFVNEIAQHAENINGAGQLATELKQMERMLVCKSAGVEVSGQMDRVMKTLDGIDIVSTDVEEFRKETDLSHYMDLLF